MRNRSVSQVNQYLRCPKAFQLARINKAWQRPASWLSQGLGVHKALEEWERSGRTLACEELETIFIEEYARSVDEQAQTTPNLEVWFGSGPYDPVTDIERRFNKGLEQIQLLTKYATEHPEEKIWVTPNGEPAIELRFEVELGGVPVVGFIDQIIETPKGLVVRDIKTGSKPGDTFQLCTYAEAMKQTYGVEINRGVYWMGKTGRPGRVKVFTDKDRANVHEVFEEVNRLIEDKHFPADPEEGKCTMCSVRTSCKFSKV